MEKKVAVVTGASRGIGAAIARELAAAGMYVVINYCGSEEKAQELKTEIEQNGGEASIYKCDVSDNVACKEFIGNVIAEYGHLDVLVNNAGLALGLEPAHRADLRDWQTMIDVNIKGLVTVTQIVLPFMVANNAGTVINIGSTAGNHPYFGANVYGASKAFVKQFSNNLRADLIGTRVRVTNIEPGMCGGTEFSNVRFKGDDDKAAAVYTGVEFLTAKDISNTVQWVVAQPWHVNINSIEMMPTAQTYAGLAVARDI